MTRQTTLVLGIAIIGLVSPGCRSPRPVAAPTYTAGLLAVAPSQAQDLTGTAADRPHSERTRTVERASAPPRTASVAKQVAHVAAGDEGHAGLALRTVSHQTSDVSAADINDPTSCPRPTNESEYETTEFEKSSNEPTVSPQEEPGPLPIDLASALELAGAETWQVQLARAKVREAAARYDAARLAWIPDLNFGVAFNHHDGELQATEGQVDTISRTSLFVGGGAAWGGFPLAGGAGGPPRLAVSVSVADAWFEPLVARQNLRASQKHSELAQLEMQRRAGLAYLDLVQTVAQYASALADLRDAENAKANVQAFVDAGKGSPLDVEQMQIFVRDREQAVIQLQAATQSAAARLATALNLDLRQLDPSLPLIPSESVPLPVELIQTDSDSQALVAQALANHPELAAIRAKICAAEKRIQQEHWRPVLPHVQVGTSAGAFGGGTGSQVRKLDGRSDFDVVMAWQLKNLGAGNRSRLAERTSQRQQWEMQLRAAQDQIANEVFTALNELEAARQNMELTDQNLLQAQSLVAGVARRIRELQAGPLELVQALRSLSRARVAHIESLTEFNRQQLLLMLATSGSP